MFNRDKLKDDIYKMLEKNYVILLSQRGDGLNAFLKRLVNDEPSIPGMKFVYVQLPLSISDSKVFKEIVFSRLLSRINYLFPDIAGQISPYSGESSIDYHFIKALDKIGLSLTAKYLVILFHIPTDISEILLRDLLLIFKGYHDNLGIHGTEGEKLRLLVGGGSCLWHICVDRTKEKYPFHVGNRVLLNGLSLDDVKYLQNDLDSNAMKELIELTGGVPSLINTITNPMFDTVDFNRIFDRLQDNWDYLPEPSRDLLKSLSKDSGLFPAELIQDTKCNRIPRIDPPFLEAFWGGFLRFSSDKLIWRSPIHKAFIENRMGIDPSSELLHRLNSLILYLKKHSAISNKLCWIHISDLHFNKKIYEDEVIFQSLLTDLKEQINMNRIVPHLIIISGDISYSGKPSQYKLVEKFLDNLLQQNSLGKESLLIVPGNHDINRKVVPKSFFLKKHQKNFSKYLVEQDKFKKLLKHFYNYQRFIGQYLGKNMKYSKDLKYHIKTLQIGERKIAILCINSAWFAGSKNDKNNLILGENLMREAINKLANFNFIIAVMHHPLDWLNPNEELAQKNILYRNCDFILQGHVHDNEIKAIKTPDYETRILVAGACYDKREIDNTYNIVELDFDKRKGKIWLRMFSDKGFWVPDVKTYRNIQGSYEFSMSNKNI